jgi:hypothetical protein
MQQKFEILKHFDLSQIQMWLNQKQTTNGNVKVQSPLFYCDKVNMFIVVISYNK